MTNVALCAATIKFQVELLQSVCLALSLSIFPEVPDQGSIAIPIARCLKPLDRFGMDAKVKWLSNSLTNTFQAYP